MTQAESVALQILHPGVQINNSWIGDTRRVISLIMTNYDDNQNRSLFLSVL